MSQPSNLQRSTFCIVKIVYEPHRSHLQLEFCKTAPENILKMYTHILFRYTG